MTGVWGHDDFDLEPLRLALARLEEGWNRYNRDRSDTQIRDGLIQRFEFTYELAHKTLRRWLRAASASPEDVSAMAFADLVRTGNQQGLLRSDWPAWRRFRELRSRTSHTYDEAIALEVVACIPEFIEEVRVLRDRLGVREAK
jgi:nucleotidyltransferase substrate binding protein (TIGR01987 family)